MSVLSKLTLANLKQNKRRTFFTVLGVTLASALMLAVAGMASSLQQTLINAGIQPSDKFDELFAAGVIIVAIIVITSVFTIRNSFSISATERTKEFGMLSSVGATERQIRWSVILEGLIIWAIGTPVGIGLGLAAVALLSRIVNLLLGENLTVPIALSIPFWIFPGIITLSLITVFLSALFPAIKTAKISPVVAIRGNREMKISPRELKTSKIVWKLFGVGGVIASKNLQRSRKKYRTTVISIVLSVATFIGLSTYMDQGFRMLDFSVAEQRNVYLLVAIFLYGFIAVIALIGITNIFNTVSANIAHRASDFASLKSIGMTSREFNQMIRLESLMYSLKALAIGIPIGLLISYAFYQAMSSINDFGYAFPIRAITIAIIAVALLISAVMRYSVHLVNKQNIIETIRSDTV